MKKESSEGGWQSFLELCLKLRTKEALEEFFRLLLTIDEQASFAKRILLLRELMIKQRPQREIAKTLGISLTKITRGSNALKTTSLQLEEFLRKNL